MMKKLNLGFSADTATWDQLMPVLKAIGSCWIEHNGKRIYPRVELGNTLNINWCVIYVKPKLLFDFQSKNSDIEAAYNAALKFTEWYKTK